MPDAGPKRRRKTRQQVRDADATVRDARLTRSEMGDPSGLSTAQLAELARLAQEEAAATRVLEGRQRDIQRNQAQARLRAAQSQVEMVDRPPARVDPRVDIRPPEAQPVTTSPRQESEAALRLQALNAMEQANKNEFQGLRTGSLDLQNLPGVVATRADLPPNERELLRQLFGL